MRYLQFAHDQLDGSVYIDTFSVQSEIHDEPLLREIKKRKNEIIKEKTEEKKRKRRQAGRKEGRKKRKKEKINERRKERTEEKRIKKEERRGTKLINI